MVWDKIILELKVLPYSGFAASHLAQIIHYLKCWHKGLGILMNLTIPARWREHRLMDYETEHLLVANRFLVHVRSIFEKPPKYDFARMKTYLNALDQNIGLIVNFGKKQLQIFGVDA